MHARGRRRKADFAKALRTRLLAFYDASARDLPWRRTRDPYRIWISEVMLQQTRASVVAHRYARFLARFPDVAALAAAPPESVCAEWAGLGYYSRARNLQAAAREIRSSHGGCIPHDADDLRRLPGVGAYTAGAIASIGFARRVPALDANAERVLARVLASEEGARADSVHELASDLVACRRPGDVNQALMDLGALVCTAHRPGCPACPLAKLCHARSLGEPERFPAARKHATKRRLEIAFAWIPARGGLWLERRALEGLWSALWQPPGEEGPQARARLSRRLGVELMEARARVVHALSHRNVEATVYVPTPPPRMRRNATLRPYRRPLDAPLSALARKAIEAAAAVAAGT